MKKIGLICLAVVLAVGALGVGYAHWGQNLYIDGTVETGCLTVGFTECCTDDDNDGCTDYKAACCDYGLDPLWRAEECPTVCTQCEPGDKDVAETTCELSVVKTCCKTCPEPDGKVCYENLAITIDNAYPQYNPSVFFDIGNCGTIPVNIVGAWIIDGAHGVVRDDPDTWIWLPKCEMVQVDLDCDDDDDVAIGFSGPDEPQQIDACQEEQFDLHFCFKQDLNPCTTYEFEIKIHALQWNKAFEFPPPLD